MEHVEAEQKLVELRVEHRDLDEVITRLAETVDPNEVQLRRLKKRKLALKDQIAKLESAMVPNIIA